MRKLWAALRLLLFNPKRFANRLQYEFVVPSNWFARALRRIYAIFTASRSVSNSNSDRLLFVYDTLSSPVTFDFLHYLYYANWLRRKIGRAYIDVLIVARPNAASLREEAYMAAIGGDNINWRLTNLLIPLFRLFPAGRRVFIVDQKEAFEIVKGYDCIHPANYGYAEPKTAVVRLDSPDLIYFPSLYVSDTARGIVETYFPLTDDRRIVTITLRTYDYIPIRNSNIASWIDFAGELDPLRYRVVFIPDASECGISTQSQISKFEVFDSACWNLELRAALYRRAWMNMGIACGPLAISGLLDKVHTVMIDRSQDYPDAYLENICSRTGITPGKAPGFYSGSCHFYLGTDDKETILKIFDEFVEQD